MRDDRRGIVLIVVLVLVVMVALAGFAFVGTMSTEYQAVKTSGDSMQARQTLYSAEMLLRQFSELPASQQQDLGGWTNNPQMFRGVALVDSTQSDTVQLTQTTPAGVEADPQWQFTIIGGSTPAAQSVGLQYGVDNESTRLHLAAVLRWENDEPGAGREALLKLPQMTPQAADGILDWIDSDNDVREFGAESDEYQTALTPYAPRNDIPQSLEELLLVKGVTQPMLFGFDVDRNFYLDDNEQRAMQSAGLQDGATTGVSGTTEDSNAFGWQRFLTVSSSESGRDQSGNRRIDLNQNSLPNLSSQLTPIFPPEIVTFIVLCRQYGPVDSAAATNAATETASSFDPSVPAIIGFVSIAELIEATVNIPTGDGETTTYASPLKTDSETIREFLPILLTRTVAGKPNVGRINLNRAPRSVLSAIPKLSDETVGRIVEQRSSLDSTSSQSAAWLLTEEILSRESFRAVLPWLTTGGDTISGQIIVFRDFAGPFTRFEFTIDTALDPPRRVKWRNLNRLGIGFPLSLLKPDGSAGVGGAWTKSY
jgi:hypothetical protein